jgi:hypothetical protein
LSPITSSTSPIYATNNPNIKKKQFKISNTTFKIFSPFSLSLLIKKQPNLNT